MKWNFILLAVLNLMSCGGGNESTASFDCPTVSDNVSWLSYGQFTFQQSGDDSTARDIIANCDWHVYNNHNGGEGDTLQIASPNEEVILVWAFNEFRAYKLSPGWTGQTENGIKIGNTITDLYAQYPTFNSQDGFNHTLVSGSDINVAVSSDINSSISSILSGFYYRN